MLNAKDAKQLVIKAKEINITDDIIKILSGIFNKTLKGESQYDFEFRCHSEKKCGFEDIVAYLENNGYEVHYSKKNVSNNSGEPMDYDDSITVIYTCIVNW